MVKITPNHDSQASQMGTRKRASTYTTRTQMLQVQRTPKHQRPRQHIRPRERKMPTLQPQRARTQTPNPK